jgi:hypothetical protein
MKAFECYINSLGMEMKGVTLHNLICNVLKNTSDDFDFQKAHQDYFPKVISIKTPNYTKLHLAWSAIIPMTSDGSWITILVFTRCALYIPNQVWSNSIVSLRWLCTVVVIQELI